MKKGILARSLAFSFAIVVSVSAHSDSEDQAVVTDQLENNLEVKLDFSQKNMICSGILNSFGSLKLHVETETGMPFSEGYKYVSCPFPGDKKIGWGIIGKAFQEPPSSRPIRVVRDMLNYLKKNDFELLYYIYTHKDHRGRGVYDYLDLAEDRFSKERDDKYKKYYAVFRKVLLRYDPNL